MPDQGSTFRSGCSEKLRKVSTRAAGGIKRSPTTCKLPHTRLHIINKTRAARCMPAKESEELKAIKENST